VSRDRDERAGMKIGVLALQGDFALHVAALRRCGVEVAEIRKPEELGDVEALVIPGGESTTLLKLMDEWKFVPALREFHEAGKPMFGTCAGLILLARDVANPPQFSLGFIDVDVERNAYGRQRESFEARGTAELDGRSTVIDMMFIRAPRIRRVGQGVQVLARHGDEPVMARQDGVLVAAFHPEVTVNDAVHRYFCDMVRAREGKAA
jgi:pyridoxal 5'-phosphate synthase pdxT subunit